MDIEANSLEEAVEIFKEKMDEVPLPSESYYVDGSFRLTSQLLGIKMPSLVSVTPYQFLQLPLTEQMWASLS